MRREILGNCELYHSTMEKTIENISANHILTDPPYLYIKTHDFDIKFDEKIFFENARRLLPDNGFIALFGRGTSFYRWNTLLANLGFIFKEEIVWDKLLLSSPCNNLSRVHETISIHTKRSGCIRKCKVPYVEQKAHDIDSIIGDIKIIKNKIKKEAGFKAIIDFLKTGKINKKSYQGHKITNSLEAVYNDTAVIMLRSMMEGMREKSIMPVYPAHYDNHHPTQKPVRLAERILALISDPGDTIYDPFMGSGSFGVACVNMGRKYIGSGMKEEYFDVACKRIKEATAQGTFDFES